MDHNYKPVFQIDTEDHGTVDWHYADQEKQWHQTWKPKAKDIVVLGKLNAEDKKHVLDLLMIEIEVENQMIRDRANAQARARRQS